MIFPNTRTRHDKHLLRLERELTRLHRAQWHAPIVPLERPYHSGWVKFYGLRADALHHPEIKAFTAILDVINRRIFCRSREFRDRAGNPIVLRPLIIAPADWKKLGWPFRFQRWFAHGQWPEECYFPWSRGFRVYRQGYKIMSTWWLEERIEPRLITHQRVELPDVRSRIAEIDRFLRHTLGRERLAKLHGRRLGWGMRKTPGELRAAAKLVENHEASPD